MNTNLKCAVMGVAALCAVMCFIFAIMANNIFLAILSLVSSFVPIVVWFLDARENEKTTKELKAKINDLENSLTFVEL